MWRLLLTAGLLCWSCDGVRVSCKDEKNHDIDWYIIYKGPRLDDKPTAGLGYIFINPEGVVKKMMNIKNPRGPLANTLHPIFRSIRSMELSFGFISYSDQPPGSNADITKFGHSKGVLMMDRTSTGVWLLHSTPQFPYRRDRNNFWPPSGAQKGQIFICATFNYNDFKVIGKHLQYIGAFPYEHDIPNNFHQELRDAVEWTQLPPPTANFPTLTSVRGTTFKAIPKQHLEEEVSEGEQEGEQEEEHGEDRDLYFTIAKDLQSDVLVQVWGNQQDESYCDAGKSVLNIQTIKTVLGQWEPGSDHSKWCVAKDQNQHWVCVGDVNRCETQYQRRGGALCVSSEKVQQKFLKIAKLHDNCPTRKRKYPCDSDSDSDTTASARTALTVPVLHLDLLNETDTGVVIDYDSDFLNDTDTPKDLSLMG